MTSTSIDDVIKIYPKGPWTTKSKGQLTVLFSLDFHRLKKFISSTENNRVDGVTDISGLRMYSVDKLAKGSQGANEWHKVRTELVFATKGSVSWNVVDRSGDEKRYVLQANGFGLWVPPCILHTYESLENDSQILVVANTIYIPEDETTHDTYDAKSFVSTKD